MGGLICCVWRMFCCECTLCEPKDDWNIDGETRPGERGAGWLYKRAKNSAMWSKRYFTISNNKLLYFMERDRAAMKGEIVLAGATASFSSTRADTKKKFFFNISHPVCGVRELYAKTRKRRLQWVERINEVAGSLQNRYIYGKLLKQGGLSKNTWQERWCICSGSTIDYFESATDNQSKGSLVIAGATITPAKVKDKFCFEVVSGAQVQGKKAGKKYVFAVEKEHERDRWVETLCKVSQEPLALVNTPSSTNPMQPAENAAATGAPPSSPSVDDEEEGVEMQPQPSRPSMVASADLKGYLSKKSPSMMKGWQKRFFVTQPNGDIHYFKSEDDVSGGKEEKGTIRLADIKSIDLNEKTGELIIQTVHKSIHLKANNQEDATDWAQNIAAWLTNSRA